LPIPKFRSIVNFILSLGLVSGIVHFLMQTYLPTLYPYFGSLWLIIGSALILVSTVIAFDAIQYLSERHEIRNVMTTYVEPWKRYVLVKTLLIRKNAWIPDFSKTRTHMEDIIQFLEATNSTRYLSRVLVKPTSFLKAGEFFFIKNLLKTARLDSLSSTVNALKSIVLNMTLGREKEVASHFVRIARRLLPDIEKMKRKLARDLSVGEDLEEILLFGVGEQQYLDLLRSTKTPQKCELELWQTHVTLEYGKAPITEKGLKRMAIGSILSFGTGLPIISSVFIGHGIVMVTSPMLISSSYSLLEGSLIFAIDVTMPILLSWVTFDFVGKGLRNYLSLSGLLKGQAIFTPVDLKMSSIDIVKEGMDKQKLGEDVGFREGRISLASFVYRCACAFLPEPHRKTFPIVSFPTAHAVEILGLGMRIYHSKASVEPRSLPTDIINKGFISREELARLSLQIIDSFERQISNAVEDKSLQDKLVWIYSNVLRVQEFDQMEVSNIGILPSYRLSDERNRHAIKAPAQ